MEQHGDDFFIIGDREYLLELVIKFKSEFKCKHCIMISEHAEDVQEGSFLHRKISVDHDGWHCELEEEYANTLTSNMGVDSQKRASTVPGSKEIGKGQEGNPLGKCDHTHFRSGAGMGQYMTDGRPDLSFSTKELLRKASAPTTVDMLKCKKMASYVHGVPRCIQHFYWRSYMTDRLDTCVDSDWSGEVDTRKSTNGGTAGLEGVNLKHWCSSQATPSLSSGESELKATVKGAIESLYICHLLSQQGYNISIHIHTDSSAALGHMNRLGNGKKMRHLEGSCLWIQHLVRSKRVNIHKISGIVNPADLFTKYLSFDRIMYLTNMLGYSLHDVNGVELFCKSNQTDEISVEYNGDDGDYEETDDYISSLWEYIGEYED